MDGKSRKLESATGHRKLPQDPELHCGPISMTKNNGNCPVLTAKVHVGMKHIARNLLLVAQSSSVERRVVLVLSDIRGGTWVYSGEGARHVREDQLGFSECCLPREQSAPFGDVEKEVLLEAASGPREPSEPGLLSSGYGKASEHAMSLVFLCLLSVEQAGQPLFPVFLQRSQRLRPVRSEM